MLTYWLLKKKLIFTYQYTWPLKLLSYPISSTDNGIIHIIVYLTTKYLKSFPLKLYKIFYNAKDFLKF